MLPFLIVMNLIRNLKYLAPFSMIANFLVGTCMIITFWYVFQDVPSTKTVAYVADWHKWPLFFGTAIFALEGIGVVSINGRVVRNPSVAVERFRYGGGRRRNWFFFFFVASASILKHSPWTQLVRSYKIFKTNKTFKRNITMLLHNYFETLKLYFIVFESLSLIFFFFIILINEELRLCIDRVTVDILFR